MREVKVREGGREGGREGVGGKEVREFEKLGERPMERKKRMGGT